MTVEPIVSRILADARAQAEQLVESAKENAQQRSRLQQAELEQAHAKALEKAREEALLQRERMIRMALLEERKRDLAMKREVIQAAFEHALEQLQNLPVEQAQAFIQHILMQARGDEQVVIAPSSEAVFTQAFLQQLNAALKKAGKPGTLTLSDQRREIGAGCILISGGVESNCTFAALLNQQRTALEGAVAAAVFPQ